MFVCKICLRKVYLFLIFRWSDLHTYKSNVLLTDTALLSQWNTAYELNISDGVSGLDFSNHISVNDLVKHPHHNKQCQWKEIFQVFLQHLESLQPWRHFFVLLKMKKCLARLFWPSVLQLDVCVTWYLVKTKTRTIEFMTSVLIRQWYF